MNAEFNFKTLAEFTDHFRDEETCLAHFATIRFANGEQCPYCSHNHIHKFSDGKRYRCADCKKDFTIKTGQSPRHRQANALQQTERRWHRSRAA